MKRVAVLLAVLLLFVLPVSCAEEDPGPAPDAIKADVMDDPYGATGAEADVLRQSGEVVVYWDTVERSERERDFEDYFAKYFGGSVTYRFCPLEDDTSVLLRDQADGTVPDVLRLTAGYWPKAALHALTYTRSQLIDRGVVGLGNPALEQYREVTEAAYTFNGECYALSVCSVSPVAVAVNVDLFHYFGVPSPVDYYDWGEWNYASFQRCCYEINRTAPGGQMLLGAVVRDPLWFLQADDADPMTFRGAALTGDLLTPGALQTLSYCRALLTSSAVGSEEKPFLQGNAGMLCDTADRLSKRLVTCPFEWDVVPFPFGDDNVSGARPGSIVGWAIPRGAGNVQGAVNYVIARQRFLNFHFNVNEAAFWDVGYFTYSEAQRRRVLDAAPMVRPALFPQFGTLPGEVDGFWSAVEGKEPIYDVADRYSALIRSAINEEILSASP